MKRIIHIILFFLAITPIYSQEICNNSIDDDLDGLVDYNDDDCNCSDEITNIIPNPSFEETNCLPTFFAEMSCAEAWIQPSNGTCDLFDVNGFNAGNTSGTFLSGNIPLVPSPLPDGSTYVGTTYDEIYNEYIGTCLDNPLIQNTSYRLEIEVGFGDDSLCIEIGSLSRTPESINLCFYGAVNCNSIPYSNFDDCPENYGIDIISCVTVTGEQGEWVTAEIEFQPMETYNAFLFGIECNTVPAEFGTFPYVFYDNIRLYDGSPTTVVVPDIEVSQDCVSGYTLSIPSIDGFDVQWLNNLEAIPNATTSSLNIDYTEVNSDNLISVVYSNSTGCFITDDISLDQPDISGIVTIPNAFTPDGDGLNDFFKPIDNELCTPLVEEFRIFNRWGAVVYTENNFYADQIQGWDGNYKGKSQPSDVYVYMMLIKKDDGNKETFKGDVTLIR